MLREMSNYIANTNVSDFSGLAKRIFAEKMLHYNESYLFTSISSSTSYLNVGKENYLSHDMIAKDTLMQQVPILDSSVLSASSNT